MTIPSTLSLSAVARLRWDAVVIGAGPAGATAALRLAQRGGRVLLVERKAFPRDKVCGGCISAGGVQLLRELGVVDELQHLGARPLAALDVSSPHRQARLRLAPGLAVSRRTLDRVLVQKAIDAGVVFLAETSAEVTAEAQSVQLEHGAASATLRASAIVAADGLGHGSLRRVVAFREQIAPTARLGGGCLLDEPSLEQAPGIIHMAITRAGYVGLAQVEAGQTNIAAAIDARFVRQSGGLGPAAAKILTQVGRQSATAVASATWRGTPALTRQTTPRGWRRVFVIGDAAGYVEPFTGEGITWALTAAAQVIPFVEQAYRQHSPSAAAAWQRAAEEEVQRRQRLCRLITQGLRWPWLVDGVLQAVALAPQLAAPIVSRITRPEQRHWEGKNA